MTTVQNAVAEANSDPFYLPPINIADELQEDAALAALLCHPFDEAFKHRRAEDYAQLLDEAYVDDFEAWCALILDYASRTTVIFMGDEAGEVVLDLCKRYTPSDIFVSKHLGYCTEYLACPREFTDEALREAFAAIFGDERDDEGDFESARVNKIQIVVAMRKLGTQAFEFGDKADAGGFIKDVYAMGDDMAVALLVDGVQKKWSLDAGHLKIEA